MDKTEELIATQTVFRAIDGNIDSARQAMRNIDYMLWMHPELPGSDQIAQLKDTARGAIEALRDYIIGHHLTSERELEDALIEKHGWN